MILRLVLFSNDFALCRVGQLEVEVSSLSERVTQLLAEKEKALADLKTIRKTNRNMEK